MGFLKYNKNLIPYARELRKQLTPTELLLWLRIRNKQILNIQFYRQKVIGKYIVDFFAPSVKLVLEIDGSQHYEPEAIEQDLSRDTYLRELGLFLAHVYQATSVFVQGYQGERPPFIQSPNSPLTLRQRIYHAVKQLPIFSWGEHPNMKNGHLRVKDKNVIERCLTLEVPEKGIQAAIYFTINLDIKSCEIEKLGVNAEFKGKHFGSILLHSAIFIALHYQCKEIALLSSDEGALFYPGQGFKIINNKYRLRFSDSESYAIFLEKMKLTCPNFDKNKLDNLIGIHRSLPHKKEMLNQWMAAQSLTPVKRDVASLSDANQENTVSSRLKLT